jgi:DNA modification methylase
LFNMAKLTEAEIRDINQFLADGKPLPDKYRFLLFDDKREVELVWNGKTNEVTNVVLPFQTIETVDEAREEKVAKLQGNLFDSTGRQSGGWTNKLIWGDNKLILSSLKSGPLREEIEAQGGIKLIYIDPPFDVGADFSMDIAIGDDTLTKSPSVIEELAYRDTWGKGADSFISMIYERLSLMRDLLADDGSIFVHCDWRVSGYMRLVLDEVFGKNNFINEIIWAYYGPGTDKAKEYTKKHDTIFYFAKNKGSHIFNDKLIRVAHSAKTKDNYKKGLAGSGFAAETINSREKESYSEDSNLNQLGKIPEDWWEMAISARYPTDGIKRMGYPTEKPLPLIERIISTGSNEGDLVADFFMGSGATAAAAELLGRKWLGSELGKFGVHTTRKRIINVQRKLKVERKPYRAFEILNLGKYERQYYIGETIDKRSENAEQIEAQRGQAFVKLITRAYMAEKVEGFRTFVARKDARLVAVGPVNVPVSRLFVDEILKEAVEKQITKVDLLAFDFEMGMGDSSRDDAKNKGIDLALKQIPRDVFDKRAVEKNQVVFNDVSYIEVKPVVKEKGKARTVTIELTDFSVHYNQDAGNDVEGRMKLGATKVVVRDGQVIKLHKDKDSEIMSQEILTKKWSDWIDYWSVDFDFESKKEIVRVKKTYAEQVDLSGETADNKLPLNEYEEQSTGSYIFENEWQSFRTKKDRSIELTSVTRELTPGKRYKIAVKVVDIFGNDTVKVIEVNL